jgi:NAD(P)-dependent dehydrogenase (short-subunit alcohol dehydrogenase family)
MKDYDFSGKIVLVTGGTGALGREVCHAFLKAGALLATTYVIDSEISGLESKIGDLKKNIFLIKKDLANEKDVQALVADVVKKYGRIDILANAIGGYMAGKPVTEIDEKDWDAMMNLNLKTAFLLSKHVVAQMIRQSSGKVIHTAARPGLRGGGNDAAYVASKSGVIRLVESLSEEVKSKGINVNCILPSIIDTEPNRKAMPNADFSKWVKPSEIARVILFLSSEDSRPINGAAIPVFGLV